MWSHPLCGTLGSVSLVLQPENLVPAADFFFLFCLFSWVQQQGPHPTATEFKSLAFPLLASKTLPLYPSLAFGVNKSPSVSDFPVWRAVLSPVLSPKGDSRGSGRTWECGIVGGGSPTPPTHLQC